MIQEWSIEEIRKLRELIAQRKQQMVQFVTGVEAEYIVFDAMERATDVFVAAIDQSGNKMVLHAYKSPMQINTIAQLLGIIQGGGLAKIRAKVIGTRIVTITSVEPYTGPIRWDGIGMLSLRGQRMWLTKTDGIDVLITDRSIKGALIQQQSDGTVIRFIGIEKDMPSGIRVMQYIHYETPPPELLMQLAEEVAGGELAGEGGDEQRSGEAESAGAGDEERPDEEVLEGEVLG